MFISTKTYGHDLGLSCAFRQWRATHSHCSLIHGYAISVHLEFEASELDDRNWVVDFGGLGSFKEILKDMFDHKLCVAEDDPKLDILLALEEEHGLADIVVLPNVGCEAFAKHVFDLAESWLKQNGYENRVIMREVEIREHGANSAKYKSY